jgi:hypothetical protein
MSTNEYETKIDEWNEKIRSLPPFLENRQSDKELPGIDIIEKLDKMMKWIQQFKNHPFSEKVALRLQNLERQIIIRSIQYRKYYQTEIPPEQILEWINDHPEIEAGRLSDSVETLRYQSFYRKLESFEDSATAIKWFESQFDSLKIDEINAFLDWYQPQQYFSTMAEKMLQNSKDIVFQAIKEEIAQEKILFSKNIRSWKNHH